MPTSVLHVAGSLGVPCLVIMHHRAAWRECSRDTRIPWYPRTHERFVRSPTDANWRRVMELVAARLHGPRVGRHAAGTTSSSVLEATSRADDDQA